MKEKEKFQTQNGYMLNSDSLITPSMEDYLEMIYRISIDEPIVRINSLAKRLSVRPSSSSKMVSNLSDYGYVKYEKYGYVTLTNEGSSLGEYLLFRHNTLNRLLCLINNSKNELVQVEQIEHFFNSDTIYNIDSFLNFYQNMIENKKSQPK